MTDGAPTTSSESQLSPAPGKLQLPAKFHTAISHQILTLVGSAFLCFEILFLDLYFDQSWFSIDLLLYGVPAIFLCVIAAHALLTMAESKPACRWLRVIFRGSPPVVYRKWIELNQHGIVFGIKHIAWEAIDELELTFMGNLVIKSRLLCGPEAPFPDKVLKFPFGAADFSTQENLLSLVRERRPSLTVNKRLGSGRKPVMQKGAQATQLMTAAIMSLLLLDVGFSSFYYLEMLKNYYLAETDLLGKRQQEAAKHFERAEELRKNPLPCSWVSGKFLKNSSVASGIWEQRSTILYLRGDQEGALKDAEQAVQEAPSNLRHRLYLTRLLVAENKPAEARDQLNKILEEHKHSFMPRLYLLAMAKSQESKGLKLEQEYHAQLDACYEDTYEGEPHWPPGGNRYFMELFYSDDTKFLLDRLLGSSYKPPPSSAVKEDTSEHRR